MKVETGNNVLIGGFIVTGSGQKTTLIRALGPSVPVPGALGDPTLELHDATGAIVATNDNWRTSQQDVIIATGAAPTNDFESAIIATLSPGNYTAVVRGAGNTTGVALVEVYDLDAGDAPTRLANISTRGDVLTGDAVMIGGFIVRGDISKRMIVRATGPSLNTSGVPMTGRLLDPILELHDGTGALIAQNDSWRSTQQAEIQASTIAPTDDREPALIATLAPGNYTAVVRGVGATTGIALIEVYDLDQPPQADGSTLYVAQLRPQNGATTQGSGSATLRLADDGLSAIISFDYTNLTGPITGMHVHGPNGQIIFDLDQATPRADGSYLWTFVPVGSFTVADIASFIQSGQTYLNLHTAAYPSGEIKGSFNFSSGAQTPPTPTPPPTLPAGTPTPSDAARFLTQATFGPTDELIAQVQSQGFATYLNAQFATPMSSHIAYVDASGVNPPTLEETMAAWWTNAVTAPDQIRQRVAFALSEIFVVSVEGSGLGDQPIGMSNYVDVLLRDAFGNFRTLLGDVTLNPAMGIYLDMLGNNKGNADEGRHPNENYARELMQLFSIGLYHLNLDGSLTLSASGAPIETYNQDHVIGLAGVCTGWTFAQLSAPDWWDPVENFRDPMMSFPNHHEPGAKLLLDGVTVPANQTPAQDLKSALDTIFNHPNVGPFICRQLIQRLVTSNPSPGYVYRVVSVFNNNGQGVRGDLAAVIRAILLDYDARSTTLIGGQGYGHQREPVVRLANLLRAFHATSPDGRFNFYSDRLGQVPLHSPSVFNFFSPDYEAPGAIAAAHLKSPEFQITTENTVVTATNLLRSAINYGLGASDDLVTLNLANEQTLTANPAQLVAHLNSLLMAGQMSAAMQTTLVNAVTQIASTNPTERVRTALYLVVNSPEFLVEK